MWARTADSHADPHFAEPGAPERDPEFIGRIEELQVLCDTRSLERAQLEADLARSRSELTELRKIARAADQRIARAALESEKRIAHAESERQVAVERAEALQAALARFYAVASDASARLDAALRPRPATHVAEPEPTVKPPEPAALPRARIQADGHFMQANPAFCRLLGYPEDELKRAMWPPATDRANAQALRKTTARVLAGDLREAPVETSYIDADGMPAVITGTLRRVEAPSGGAPCVELALEPR